MINDHLGMVHTDHPLRTRIPIDHNLSDLECVQLTSYLTRGDYEDWETISSDYDWPADWSFHRQMIALYCAVSEYQLLQYLKGSPMHVADKKMHSVFRLWKKSD